MIANAIVHLVNDLPIMVDLEALPGPDDRSIRCTNVRTVDGKRPSFVVDQHATFVFPLSVIRLIEAQTGEYASRPAAPSPAQAGQAAVAEDVPPTVDEEPDEEPDEDLLERIRSI